MKDRQMTYPDEKELFLLFVPSLYISRRYDLQYNELNIIVNYCYDHFLYENLALWEVSAEYYLKDR